MSGWEFKETIGETHLTPTALPVNESNPPTPLLQYTHILLLQLTNYKENAFYCICTTNSFRIFSNSDLVDKIMMVMIFMMAMIVMMFTMAMPYRNRLHPRSRVLWRAATIPKPHLLWPHPPEISGVSHDAFQIFTPKKSGVEWRTWEFHVWNSDSKSGID